MKVKTRWLLINLIASAAVLFHLFLFLGYLGQRWELLLLDAWFMQRGQISPPRDVVVVSIDEESYRRLGVSPLRLWPRQRHVELLERLAGYKAKRVVFDIMFSGTSEDETADKRLAEAFRLVPTVLASSVTEEPAAGGSLEQEPYKVMLPLPMFMESAETVGSVEIPLDAGVARRFARPYVISPQTPFTLAEAALGPEGQRISRPGSSDFVNYYGPAGTITRIPYYRALDRENPLPLDVFAGKTVFVGYWLPKGASGAAKDLFFTPFYGTPAFGVEINATMAANMLQRNWIRRFSMPREVISLGISLYLLSLLLLSLRPSWGAFAVLSVWLVWGFSSYASFLSGYFLPGATAAFIVLPLLFLSSTLVYYLETYRSRQKIKEAFGRYLHPDMVEQIARDAGKIELGGQSVEAAILFSDIKGFAATAEHMKPHEISRMLNRYFTEAAEIVLEHRGTLVKFAGDGMYVIWGAPIPLKGSCDLALSSAVSIQQRIAELAARGEIPEIETRIGIHWGEVIAGNLGSEKRLDYTAIGDAVNLASRLEQLNKHFGTPILLSEAVLSKLEQEHETIPMGEVRVYGRKEPVRIFAAFPTPLTAAVRALWEEALSAYRNRDWKAARESLQQAVVVEPRLELAAALYKKEIDLNCCVDLDEGWRGEMVFSEK